MNRCVTYIALAIIGLGIILRFAQYIPGRSVNYDEANIVYKLKNYTLKQLLLPEGDNFVKTLIYPVGFLFIQKNIVDHLGDEEWKIRFFPFFCSIFSLIIFWWLASSVLKPIWSLSALLLFSISTILIYYSSEAKPYSSDILFALTAYWTFLKIKDKDFKGFGIFLLCILGIIFIFFSFPSIFVIASGGILLAWHFIKKKDWNCFKNLSIFLGVCAGAFLIYYICILRIHYANSSLESFWNYAFMPVESGFWESFKWLVVVFKRLADRRLHMPISLSNLAFVVGVILAFIRGNLTVRIFVVSVFVTLIAAILGRYPFDGRTVAFLLPAYILTVTYGLQELVQNQYSKILTTVIIVFIFFYPVQYSLWQFLTPVSSEDIKPVLSYVAEYKDENEEICVYSGTLPAYRYYAQKYGLSEDPCVLTITPQYTLRNENVSFLKKTEKFWVVFTHVKYNDKYNFRLRVIEIIRQFADLKNEYAVKTLPKSTQFLEENNISASAYLFELRK